MSDEWELWYHGFLAGRGEFIRLIFEDQGVKYKEMGDKDELAKIRCGERKDFYPGFAPPYIKKGDFTLNQTQVICKYLGKQFGLWPAEEVDMWHADQINTTLHDYLGEGRLVFHGAGFCKSYYEQKEETQPYIDWFKAERFEKWLKIFERNLVVNGGGDGFLVGDKATYVDFALLHCLRASEAQFPDEWKALQSIPKLKAFKERMEARPNLVAYFKSDRCKGFEGNSMM